MRFRPPEPDIQEGIGGTGYSDSRAVANPRRVGACNGELEDLRRGYVANHATIHNNRNWGIGLSQVTTRCSIPAHGRGPSEIARGARDAIRDGGRVPRISGRPAVAGRLCVAGLWGHPGVEHDPGLKAARPAATDDDLDAWNHHNM